MTARRTSAPQGLLAGGKALWAELDGAAAPAPRRALIEEACRTKDRLDRLDRVIVKASPKDLAATLAAANATTGVLVRLLDQLGHKVHAAAEPAEDPTTTKGADLDILRERMADRGVTGPRGRRSIA